MISNTAGSDGSLGRAQIGSDFRCDFDADSSGRDANEAERRVIPAILRTADRTVRGAHPLIPGLDRRQPYKLLGETILGQRLARHDEINWAVRLPVSDEE